VIYFLNPPSIFARGEDSHLLFQRRLKKTKTKMTQKNSEKLVKIDCKKIFGINCDFEKEVIFIKMNKLPFLGSNQGPHI
jgi:hypothetical protein